MRVRVVEVVQVAIVLACWIAGAVLRFQPMPARAVGGGLLIAGFVLLAWWARRERARR
jgi:predicted MFS family arabinose efflux permease